MNQPELAPYGASKWAVNKLTDDLSYKLEGTGARMNTLDPGWLRTDMGGENASHPVEAVLPGGLALHWSKMMVKMVSCSLPL